MVEPRTNLACGASFETHCASSSSVQDQCKISLGQLKRFSWCEIQVATNDFSETGIIGQGGFEKVYRGKLADNTDVAVKFLSDSQNPGGEASFLRNVQLIIVAVHRNLLRLIGFCTTEAERILLSPYMKNLSVAHHLRRLVDTRLTHVTAQVRGTLGHIAPEYLTPGKCSEKTDVFGYGITLLELITGQHVIDFSRIEDEEDVLLLDHIKKLLRENRLHDIGDNNLKTYDPKEVEIIIQVALLCTQPAPEDRPRISEVVKMLKGVGLAERWGEWERLEEATNRELQLSLMTHGFAWMHESTMEVQEALQLSAPR